MPNFTDETIANLFGAEDAEMESNDRFRQYFIYNKIYENVISSLPLRILVGHKGVGKSALLRRARMHDEDNGTLAILVRPNDVLAITENRDPVNFSALVECWKQGLLRIIAKHVLGDAAGSLLNKNSMSDFADRISSFIGAVATTLSNKSGSASQEINQGIIDNFIKTGIIHIYIDDIDRGWSASRADIMNISALLAAMRDIAGSDKERRIRFRIGLRSDVYFLVRTSDESTDKIETSVVWLSWTNHEVLCIIAKRIDSFFGVERDQDALLSMDQASITTQILAKVIAPVFLGAGHWSNRPIHNVLLFLTRQRPRDLVKLMHGAAKNAQIHNHDIISSADLEQAFPAYSNERLQDIINEFRSELPQIERLLLGMRPTTRERKAKESYLFSGDKLSTKLAEIMRGVNLQFANGRPISGKALIQFLYKIDFITARKAQPSGEIARQYFDRSRFLANEYADFGFEWEIHPAYRWALQPQNIQDVIDSLGR